MNSDKTFEDELLELIDDAHDERRKAEQRLAAARRAIETLNRKIEALQLTLDTYRTKYGLPKMAVTMPVTEEQARQYRNLSVKDMILRWADQHDGEVAMRDACRFLASAGLFTDERQAAGTLYSTIQRMAEFEKDKRGLYRKVARPARTAQSPTFGTSERLVDLAARTRPSHQQARAAAGDRHSTIPAQVVIPPDDTDPDDLPFD